MELDVWLMEPRIPQLFLRPSQKLSIAIRMLHVETALADVRLQPELRCFARREEAASDPDVPTRSFFRCGTDI
tara:strand:- start:43389 stop:43607 length:219 start_codon:yes stop_codon:yes gene_type:complete